MTYVFSVANCHIVVNIQSHTNLPIAKDLLALENSPALFIFYHPLVVI